MNFLKMIYSILNGITFWKKFWLVDIFGDKGWIHKELTDTRYLFSMKNGIRTFLLDWIKVLQFLEGH